MLSTQQFMFESHMDPAEFSLINPIYFDYQQHMFPQIPEFPKLKAPENEERIFKLEDLEPVIDFKMIHEQASLPKFSDDKDRYSCAFSLNLNGIGPIQHYQSQNFEHGTMQIQEGVPKYAKNETSQAASKECF